MTKETALKRIVKALKDSKDFKDLNDAEINVATDYIYNSFMEFERDDEEYSSTTNLKYAIDIWIEDTEGIEALNDILNEEVR